VKVAEATTPQALSQPLSRNAPYPVCRVAANWQHRCNMMTCALRHVCRKSRWALRTNFPARTTRGVSVKSSAAAGLSRYNAIMHYCSTHTFIRPCIPASISCLQILPTCSHLAVCWHTLCMQTLNQWNLYGYHQFLRAHLHLHLGLTSSELSPLSPLPPHHYLPGQPLPLQRTITVEGCILTGMFWSGRAAKCVKGTRCSISAAQIAKACHSVISRSCCRHVHVHVHVHVPPMSCILHLSYLSSVYIHALQNAGWAHGCNVQACTACAQLCLCLRTYIFV
jgi:hypothetical protein